MISIIIAVATFFETSTLGQSTVVDQVFEVEQSFSYIRDPSKKLTIEDVYASSQGWQKQSEAPFPEGYDIANYWVKIEVVFDSGVGREWVLAIQDPQVATADFYHHGDDIIKLKKNRARYFYAPFIPVKGKNTFYVMSSTYGSLQLATVLRPLDKQNELINFETTMYALILGCFLTMILYNFSLYLQLRDPLTLKYTLFVSVNAFLSMLLSNFPSGLSDLGGISQFEWCVSYRQLGPITAIIFMREFLSTKERMPIFDKFCRFYIASLVLTMLLYPISPRLLPSIHNILDLLFLIGAMTIIIGAIRACISGLKAAKIYLIGQIFFLLGIITYLVTLQGGLPKTPLTMALPVIGQVLEVLLMSIALATRIKNLEEEKTAAEVKAEQADKLRYLLRVICHDISNPLTVILGLTNYAEQNGQRDPYLDKVRRSAKIIADITSHVRSLEAMETENSSMILTSVSLKEAFDFTYFLFEQQSQTKGVTLVFELEEENLCVMAEQTSLKTVVLSNLVSNAIKFSFSGQSVVISAHSVGDKVLLSVTDKGTGIPQEIMDSLFNAQGKFASSAGTDGEPGTGFGMALMERYVTAYGGKIDVVTKTKEDKGQQDHGTKISITLHKAAEGSKLSKS